MSTRLEFYTVDAFTREAFCGNPAAVIILAPDDLDDASESSSNNGRPPRVDDALSLKLAAEFNLSETAFAKPIPGGSPDEPKFELRWFTPTEEIPLCGHATLATAQIIFSHHHPSAKSISFQSRTRGELVARKNDANDGSISLDFPASSLVTLSDGHKRRAKVLEKVTTIVDAAVIERIDWADEIGGVVVELSETVDLKGLTFDPSVLSGLGSMVILTQPAPKGSQQDILSRVFGPDIGVPEDPVTGAAHTALAPFWISSPSSLSRLHDHDTINRDQTIRARQVSKRSGEIVVKFDKATKRVQLIGWAREMMHGTITL